MAEGDGVIPAKRVEVDAGQRREVFHFLSSNFKQRTRLAPRPAGIHEDHFRHAPHLEGHIHSPRAAIGAEHTLGQAAIPEPPDQDRTSGIVTPQDVATADDEGAGYRHPISPIRNFASSRPVLPS